MKYVSIDIETTGLNPTRHQLIEFGAVCEVLGSNTPIGGLPTFRALIPSQSGEYRASPFIIKMHESLFLELGDVKRDVLESEDWYRATEGSYVCYIQALAPLFQRWLDELGITKVIPAGKNFYGFDYRFLELWFEEKVRFHKRALDPVMYFLRESDVKPPDLATCCERAGVPLKRHHTAVGDALTVVSLIRVGSSQAATGSSQVTSIERVSLSQRASSKAAGNE